MNRRLLLAVTTICFMDEQHPIPVVRSPFDEPTASEINFSLAIPLHPASKLTVNTDHSFRLNISQSEREGLQDLRKLAQEADREEAYAFIPEEERWVEIGYNESAIEFEVDPNGEISGRVTVAYDPLLEDLLKRYQSLAVYHFHPHLFAENLTALLKEHPPKEGTLEDAIAFELDNQVLPSPIDLYSMIRQSAKYYNQYHPEGSIAFHVVSVDGVTRYEIDSDLRVAFSQGDSYEVASFAKTLAQTHVLAARREFWEKSGKERTAYIHGLNFLGLKISYTPFEPEDRGLRR